MITKILKYTANYEVGLHNYTYQNACMQLIPLYKDQSVKVNEHRTDHGIEQVD